MTRMTKIVQLYNEGRSEQIGKVRAGKTTHEERIWGGCVGDQAWVESDEPVLSSVEVDLQKFRRASFQSPPRHSATCSFSRFVDTRRLQVYPFHRLHCPLLGPAFLLSSWPLHILSAFLSATTRLDVAAFVAVSTLHSALHRLQVGAKAFKLILCHRASNIARVAGSGFGGSGDTWPCGCGCGCECECGCSVVEHLTCIVPF